MPSVIMLQFAPFFSDFERHRKSVWVYNSKRGFLNISLFCLPDLNLITKGPPA